MTLEQMKNIDIRTVDHNTLVDATDCIVDLNLPKADRMAAVKDFLGNPYCFRCGKIAVKLSYTQTTTTIDDRVESYMRSL